MSRHLLLLESICDHYFMHLFYNCYLRAEISRLVILEIDGKVAVKDVKSILAFLFIFILLSTNYSLLFETNALFLLIIRLFNGSLSWIFGVSSQTEFFYTSCKDYFSVFLSSYPIKGQSCSNFYWDSLKGIVLSVSTDF